MSKADSSEGLDYARDLYKLIVDWYKNADSKAQVLLTLDGVFLTFLTTSIFTNPEESSKLFAMFTTTIWLFLLAMCACLTVSIFSAFACLWSRLYLPPTIDLVLHKQGIRPSEGKTYPSRALGFFQFIGHFQEYQFRERLNTLDHQEEMKILAFQLIEVSKNVTKKHFWVDCGFLPLA